MQVERRKALAGIGGQSRAASRVVRAGQQQGPSPLMMGLMVGSKSILQRSGLAAAGSLASSIGDDEGEFDPRSQPHKSAWLDSSAWPDPTAPPLVHGDDSKGQNNNLGQTIAGRRMPVGLQLPGIQAGSSSRAAASQVRRKHGMWLCFVRMHAWMHFCPLTTNDKWV